MAIRAVIVDDEPLARERLRTLLEGESDIDLVAECRNGHEAVSTIVEQRPDLVFLDVQMPELDGFEVLEALGSGRLPAIIFVTAYDQYALEAFEVHALDYLLKPFDRSRFVKAMARARSAIGGETFDGEGVRRLVAQLRRERSVHRLVVKSAGRVVFLRTDEVDWIEAAGNYVKLYTADGTHMMRETLKSLEERLDPERFLRVHRSRIVNLDRVRELQPWFHGEYVVILRDGTELQTGRTYSRALQNLLDEAR